MLEKIMARNTGAASSNPNRSTHTHTHCFYLPGSDFSALSLGSHWKLVHKSNESLTPTSAEVHLVTSRTNVAARTEQLTVIYISVEYGQEGAEHVHWPSIYWALLTYFRPFVSFDNYSDLWRTVCPLTQIRCSGDNLISLRTSWKQPEGHILQIQQQVDSTHKWLSRWPSLFFEKWWTGDKNTDSVNWNSYNGLIF